MVLAACSSGGGDGDALSDRVGALLDSAADDVAQRLAVQGLDLTADDVRDADVACSSVELAAGDTGTCRGEVGERSFEIDVEVGDDGAVTLVGVAVAP